MFKSVMTTQQLVNELQNEIDVAQPVPAQYFKHWLNSLEQLLYSEVIKECTSVTVSGSNPLIKLDFSPDTNCAQPRFEDIYAVFADGTELTRTTMRSARNFTNVYYKAEDGFMYKKGDMNGGAQTVEIVYYRRPALREISTVTLTGNVMLPDEFLDMVRAKLRAECYKIVNEDAIAAKWMNDYNILLETFKAWSESHRPKFGA